MKEIFECKKALQYAVKPKTDYNKEFVESIELTSACKKAFEELSKGDESPFQFVQELKFGEKYPASDGSIYTKEWVDSYVSVLQKAPIAGSKDGHTAMNAYMERVSNEVYLIGAKITSDDTVLLRHYITKEMPEYEYKKLIKEMKAGLLSTSVFSYTKFKVIIDEKEDTQKWYAIESIGAERNDIVEWNQTGMVSGVVATAQKNNIDKQENKTMEGFTLEEATAKIINYCNTFGGDKRIIAEKLGLKEVILTEADAKKVKKFDELESKFGDLEEFINSTINAQKDNFESIKAAEISKAFPDNPLAQSVVSDMIGKNPIGQKELIEKIEESKKLESIKNLISNNKDSRDRAFGSGNNESKTIEFTV